MGFINPGRNNNDRIAGIRLRDRPSCPPIKGPRRAPAAAAAASSSSSAPKRPPKRCRPSSSSSSSSRRHTAPPPPLPQLSRFESLPPEILHSIFTHSHNLHLARTSPHLARTLAARSLQLAYVRAHAADAAALSRAFTLRFFTRAFLALWERRFARALDCTGTHAPPRALLARSGGLGAALLARGAVLAPQPEERGAHLEVLHGALEAGDGEGVRGLVGAGGLRPDVESLVLAVRCGAVGVDVCALLAARGADVRDVRVWREALAVCGTQGERGAEVVGWLLEGAAPPGEVLGELSGLYGGH